MLISFFFPKIDSRFEKIDFFSIIDLSISYDLKPRVLFAEPTSNRSANVPVLSNLSTDPYLDTAVSYVRKPV